MKPLLHFFILSLLLTSCSSGHPPIDLPEDFLDTTRVLIDPYQPDSICIFERKKDGNLVGEWMEMGDVMAIVSEVECFAIDTTGFATRRQKRWVIKNDSAIDRYYQDVQIKNDNTDITLSGDNGESWTYRRTSVNDSILMVDDRQVYYDTLRIVRLEADTLILGSVRYKWGFRPPEVKSVLYFRRK